ncbi:hypothetical protein EVAR_38821_1 [Eumeta japonica]|uniref:Uncharacterized protein n=1 Tax=Eumeta variegata TaxID=151549 RepID=A0A4C1XR08_EUMVA|nr:hypothetical protein EVAR_38821_1 [Eumeta japonica]
MLIHREKNGLETQESRVGLGLVLRTGLGSKTRPGLRLTLNDTIDEEIHSMPPLTELRAITIWASRPQERAEQRLSGQL